MSKHTPGPWVYFGDDSLPFWGEIRGTEDFSLIAQQVDGDDRHEDFVLMAAAPALLEAAKQALDWLNADERTAWAKPSREYIATLLDAAIAAADPDFVC